MFPRAPLWLSTGLATQQLDESPVGLYRSKLRKLAYRPIVYFKYSYYAKASEMNVVSTFYLTQQRQRTQRKK